MSKHTPGSWTLERDTGAPTTIIGEPIAIVGGKEMGERVRFIIGRRSDYGPHGDAQTEANARLIAAAPDLLKACELLLNCMSHVGWEHGRAAIKGREAIAKARKEAVQ